MNTKTYLQKLFALVLLLANYNSIAQTLDWARQIGGTGNDLGTSLTIDAQGYIYLSGLFSDTVDLDPGNNTFNTFSVDATDGFVSKLDSMGNLIWTKVIAGTGNQTISAISLDNLGNVIVTGYFEDDVDFNPGTGTAILNSFGNNDIFILKLNPTTGGFVWVKQIGGSGNEATRIAVKTDPQGKIYFCGYFEQTVDFDTGTGIFNLTSAGGYDGFVCQLDSSGNLGWVKQFAGSGIYQYPLSLAIDNTGSIYITGSFNGDLDLDPGIGNHLVSATTTAILDGDIFICKLDNIGNFLWGASFGSPGTEQPNNILIDNFGAVILSGIFTNTIDFDFGLGIASLTSFGSNDVFLLRLDASGAFLWVRQFGGVASDVGGGLEIDASGNIYLAGAFKDYADFDPGASVYGMSTQLSYLYNTFLCKLDNSGAFVNAISFFGHQNNPSNIAIDSYNNIIITGVFGYNNNYIVDFDPGNGISNLASNGNGDLYLTRLNQSLVDIQNQQPISLINIMVYPNPTQGITTVALQKIQKSLTVKIYNSTGQLLQTVDGSNTNTLQITLPYKTGVYFAEVIMDDGVKMVKVMRE
ncbi:MAG TPA: T9SS type A sorting domain-containing protein [Bacteroidia bacterium]|nr:T9SS type A sorting domain-containing protein [Bacteroidia bacterium]